MSQQCCKQKNRRSHVDDQGEDLLSDEIDETGRVRDRSGASLRYRAGNGDTENPLEWERGGFYVLSDFTRGR